MKCYNHKNVDAVGICKDCGIAVCSKCGVLLGGKLLCSGCKERVLNNAKLGGYRNVSLSRRGGSVQDLIENFDYYLKKFDKALKRTSRWGDAVIKHGEVMEKIRRAKDFSSLLEDTSFLKTVYETVDAFGMNSRSARMRDLDTFQESILGNTELILKLKPYELESISLEELENIREPMISLFSSLDVMESNARLVGVSKTLAHLLPDLIPPMDRGKVNVFFYGNTNLPTNARGETRRFWELLKKFHFICKEVKLTRKNRKFEGFSSSIPKIIDNAIWGFLEEKKGAV